MLIKHLGPISHQMPIVLNVKPRFGRSTPPEDGSSRPTLIDPASVKTLLPGRELNIELADPFDPFIVGMFDAGILGGDLKGAQDALGDQRDDTQREMDAHDASRAKFSELKEIDKKIKEDAEANSNRSAELDKRKSDLDAQEARIKKMLEDAQALGKTAGAGLGWTSGGVDPATRETAPGEAPEPAGDVSLSDGPAPGGASGTPAPTTGSGWPAAPSASS